MDAKERKRERDRVRMANIYRDFKQRRQALFDKRGNCCACCGTKDDVLQLHHVWYHPTESDYPTHARSMHVRLKRLKEAELRPERFALLCTVCHGLENVRKPYWHKPERILGGENEEGGTI